MQGATLDRLDGGKWRIWLHTNDHVYGTYLLLYSDGLVERITVRDGYEDVMLIKPAD